jgi:F420-dependent oxidoreductase-like protein
MIEIALMVEGQNGLNWERWQRIALAAETLGFAGLHRSDHFTNARPPDMDSLELWVSLTWLASHTSRITFGPLVSPVSFRHPALTARMASAVDDLSGGRLILGLGAGWQQREHEHFGYDLLKVPDRFRRFEEGLDVITQLLENSDPVNFEGQFYRLQEAILLPRPNRPGGPPVLIGGNGPHYTLPLVVRFAREWNAVATNSAQFAELSAQLDEMLVAAGRQPDQVRRSMMTNCIYAPSSSALADKLQSGKGGKSPDELRKEGRIVGTGAEIVEQIGQLERAGVQRVMLQWLDLDDMDGLEGVAADVLPHFTK